MPRTHLFTPEQVREASEELGDWLERSFTFVSETVSDGAEAVVDGAEAFVQIHLDAVEGAVDLAKDALESETAKWVWGTLQGGFNEKAVLSQVLMDAAISCIPIVGDITAARDLVALSLSWAKEPKKMRDPLQWVYCVVLCASLVPVAGGVIKGVGRLAHRSMKGSKVWSAAEKLVRNEQLAADIIALLNRLGVGHAEAWLKKFRFTDHADALAKGFQKLVYRLREALVELRRVVVAVYKKHVYPKVARVVDPLLEKINHFIKLLERLKEYPVAKQFLETTASIDKKLKEIRQFVINGFEKPKARPFHDVRAGTPNVTYADELMLLEGKGAQLSMRGGYVANPNVEVPAEIYVKKEGYPDLMGYARKVKAGVEYPDIATFSGKIVNRELAPGETIYRVFGEKGTTLGQEVARNHPAGNPELPLSFWGVGEPPKNAETWRKQSAVIDEWNRDGYILVGRVSAKRKDPLRACVGLVAEQAAPKLRTQYLPGGGKQAMIEFESRMQVQMNEIFDQVIASKKAQHFEMDGIEWEMRPTGWEDANGIHGHSTEPSPLTVFTTSRLASDEIVPKLRQEESK